MGHFENCCPLPSREPEHSPSHLELDVSHICSYGYVCVCVRVRGGASVCSSLQKQGNFRTQCDVACTLTPHRVSGVGLYENSGAANEKLRGKKESIYNSILCRIFIGLLCHWSHALRWPCPARYHVIITHRLVLMTRGWFDCFFHVKCIFRNKCLCFKTESVSFFFVI